MDQHYWIDRWKKGEIGFHQQSINLQLQRYYSQLVGHPSFNHKIFVPLCGKSQDMCWLAEQGLNVIGVEFSEIAIKDFFVENKLEYHFEKDIYSTSNINILNKDFFKITTKDLQETSTFFDRASIIALPPSTRKMYAEHLSLVMPNQCQGLMLVIDYDQNKISGPPFSVSISEVVSLFPTHKGWSLKHLETENAKPSPAFLASGIQQLYVHTLLLTRNVC